MTGESCCDAPCEAPCNNNRWRHWFGTLVFSIVAIVSLTSSVSGKLTTQVTEVKWAASAIITTLCLAALAVLAHGAKDKFIGTPVETGLAFIVMALMAAALPAIMKPGNNIAVSIYGGIYNANLYFFSWGTFFTALFAFLHIMQNVYKVGVGTKNTKFTSMPWIVLMSTSLIAMSSASRLWKQHECQGDDQSHCKRLEYGFALGAISGILSFIWFLIGARCHILVDAGLSVLMLILWCFAVAYVTFGEAAPALVLGNLYFSTWISFIITCSLVSAAIPNMIAYRNQTAEAGDSGKSTEEGAAKEGEVKGAKEEEVNKDDKAAGDDEEAGPAEGEHNA